MSTICGEMCANQICEGLELLLFNLCRLQTNHTQLFPVKTPCGHAAYCCASAVIKVTPLLLTSFTWRFMARNVICYMGMLTMRVWKYLVLTRWRTQQNVFLFNSGDISRSCHADWGCDWWAYVAQHSFSFFTTYQQTVEDFFFKKRKDYSVFKSVNID